MDFDVSDFNVRLRTIRIRELILTLVIAFIFTVVVASVFPSIGEDENLALLPFILVVLMFFAWALRGTNGLKTNFSKIFEVENRKEILYIFLINLLFAFIVVAFSQVLMCLLTFSIRKMYLC